MKLLALGIIALIIVGYTAYTMFGAQRSASLFAGSTRTESVQAEPIRTAKKIYAEKKSAKTDFDQSPCLAEDMGDGYALDIVHNPRLTIDDQNKCMDYEQGKVDHLIEMTPDGNVATIK
jgi:hypothetical protein